jgi:hypothetical protein
MNVEIETEAPIFLFWEYLLPIFGIFSLQRKEAGKFGISFETIIGT